MSAEESSSPLLNGNAGLRASDHGSDHASDWAFQPGVTYLNHGSFGASPLVVQAARTKWIREHEANPMDFFVRRLPGLLEASLLELAKFINAPVENLIFTSNATSGMNIVAENTHLSAGDEVLLTDHEYGAVIRIWGQYCQKVGAKTVMARLPFPLTTADELIEALFASVTPRTKLIVVSHVTSATGLNFPIKEICARAKSIGVPVCVDGPHAPAHVPVDLQQIDCDYYAASCHKWLCAPFGTGFLYVRSRHKQGLRPNVISWGRSLNANAPIWKDEFHWPGTFDPTGCLCLPDAIQFMKQRGIDHFRNHSHTLVRSFRIQLIDRIGATPLSPDDLQWYGSMSSMQLPLPNDTTPPGAVHSLQRFLWETHQIEIPVSRWHERKLIRASAHLYTQQHQIDHVVDAIEEWLKTQRK